MTHHAALRQAATALVEARSLQDSGLNNQIIGLAMTSLRAVSGATEPAAGMDL
jgi:hypothetical protein